jgi:hypothetical protein
MYAANAARDRRRAAAREGRCCAACGTPIIAQRATRRSCSERCYRRLYRRRHQPAAHQRRIRERYRRSYPRPRAASLAGYSVEEISRAEAEALIQRYEWLGNAGRATVFIGLRSPEGELHGVASFGYGPGGPIRKIIGDDALCLSRGCCVHYAPENAASFLISRAVKLIYRKTGTPVFFAYADPAAGEYGGVYQACGWSYLGQGLNGAGKERHARWYVLPPGGDPDDPAHWRTDRDLRRAGRRLTRVEAEDLGWKFERRPCKHVYAVQIGGRHAWHSRPYLAPRPEMKRR